MSGPSNCAKGLAMTRTPGAVGWFASARPLVDSRRPLTLFSKASVASHSISAWELRWPNHCLVSRTTSFWSAVFAAR